MASRDGDVICTLCAHNCRITTGESGLCMVRTDEAGEPALPYFAHVSALHVDPIEKKPLYHFHPGAELLSVGFLGCNFRCPFCQNYSISQSTRAKTRMLAPDELPGIAAESGALGVAYTYNEPTIHYEYLMAASEAVSEAGLANTLVTNGHLNRRPARELLARMDAVNVDLKSFRADFYEQELGGSLKAVIEFIEIAAELSRVEVTTLLIPGKNDSDEEIESIASFIASLGSGIPLHLSGYYPAYNYVVEATTPAGIERALEIARRHLDHVYRGNSPGDASTRCASCGATLVARSRYRVDASGLSGSRCAACGEQSSIHWFSQA